jgi:hypothetical protein
MLVTSGTLTDSAEGGGGGPTLYITNNATDTLPTLLSENFTLPFDFDGNLAGTEVSELRLSKYLIAVLEHVSADNTSILAGTIIISNESFNIVKEKSEQGNVNYWLQIPSNFSPIYATSNITSVELHHFTSGILGSAIFEARLGIILGQPPFTIVDVRKSVFMRSVPISVGGEEGGFDFGVGFAGFLGILIAVLAPAPFVSASFAGEREKKTMEALLALPISRRTILLGKLCAGMALVGIFALMNIVGMFLNNYLLELAGSGDAERMSQRIEMGMIDLTPLSIFSITVAIILAAFIAIGLGISIASLTKDVRTSETLYQMVMLLPAMLTGLVSMFVGVPESLGAPGALLLYLIPWTHSIAIFIKMSSPAIYNLPSQSLTGFGLIGDLAFHLGALFISILVVITIASKIFDREGIVN